MKIYLDMIGCRLNQSEIEIMARQFTAAGHTLVADPSDADLAVVNTCTVTSAAAADSRKAIRRIARSGVDRIISTGCWSTLYPGETQQLPGVVQVIPNDQKEGLVPLLLSQEGVTFHQKPQKRVVIPGRRLRTRAFIKVQDGCSHHCTFCITTVARGDSMSIPIEDVIPEISSALQGGSKEVVFTGVQLGSWGKDFDPPLELSDLIEGVLKKTGISRLRLSSIEPWDVTDRLIDILQEGRVARHLHLPLQSGSRSVMRRMARAITPDLYADLVKKIRTKIPEIAITTDLMVGFPGETEDEFNQNLDFIQRMNFSGGHVFTYSAREGTPAAVYPDQVPFVMRKKRSAVIRNVISEGARDYRKGFLGKELPVLWERVEEDKDGAWKAYGLTDNYLRIEADADPDFWNTISSVRLVGLTPKGLRGEVIQNR
jgi:threonylcarbamoyladenosine tRNA methylthiotransferase MtaB